MFLGSAPTRVDVLDSYVALKMQHWASLSLTPLSAADAFIAKPPRLSVLKKTMTESLFAEFALPANRRSLSLLRGSKTEPFDSEHHTLISKTPRWPTSQRLNGFDAVSPRHLLMVKARGSSFIDYLEES